MADAESEIIGLGYGSSWTPDSEHENDYVTKLKQKRNSYDTMIKNYEETSTKNRTLLTSYRDEEITLRNELIEKEELKRKLNSDFHKKYFGFIQEGTWTSNDYYDPDLYYQMAN